MPTPPISRSVQKSAGAPDQKCTVAPKTEKSWREAMMIHSGAMPNFLAFQRFMAGHNVNEKGPVDDIPEPERKVKTIALLRSALGVKSRKELADSDVLCSAMERILADFWRSA